MPDFEHIYGSGFEKTFREDDTILWVVPVLSQLGFIPLDATARVDIVPVDFVSQCIVELVERRELKHRRYHVSASAKGAMSIGDLISVASRVFPQLAKCQFVSDDQLECAPFKSALSTVLGRALLYYKPFLDSDLTYSHQRLENEIGAVDDKFVRPDSYLCDLLAQISRQEAIEESALP